MLGVPGLFDAYRAGNVTLVNAPGTGIADDKAVYTYVPRDHRVLSRRKGRSSTTCRPTTAPRTTSAPMCSSISHELVVKEVHGSGGYGMMVGPTSTKAMREEFAAKDQGAAGQLHRAADAGAFDLPDLRQATASRRGMSICRPYRAGGRPDPHHPGRADAGGAQEGLAGGQFLARAAAPRTPGCWRTDACSARTAANLFWLSRYVERAENMARLLEAGYRMCADRAPRGRRQRASDLDDAGGRGRRGSSPKSTRSPTSAPSPISCCSTTDNPSSVVHCLQARAHQCALGAHGADLATCGRASTRPGSNSRRSDPRRSAANGCRTCCCGSSKSSHQFRGALLGTILQRRRLRLLAARQFHRAGRQYGAHSRHEILRAAAARDAWSAARSTSSNGR